MSNYSIENHSLSLNADLNLLNVSTKSPVGLAASFALSTAHRVKTLNGDFVIAPAELGDGFKQPFSPDQSDAFRFTDSDGIGISDLRTLKLSQFYYHLNRPIIMQSTDGILTVECPCASSACTAPSSECCTIEEL
jgi:hypothetical protein